MQVAHAGGRAGGRGSACRSPTSDTSTPTTTRRCAATPATAAVDRGRRAPFVRDGRARSGATIPAHAARARNTSTATGGWRSAAARTGCEPPPCPSATRRPPRDRCCRCPASALGTARREHQELAARRRAARRVRAPARSPAGVFHAEPLLRGAGASVCRRAPRVDASGASARWSSTPATPTPAPASDGLADARAHLRARSRRCSAARRDEVLPFSTGVIMEPLPVGTHRRRRCPRRVAALAPTHWFARGATHHDHRHGAEGRVAPRRRSTACRSPSPASRRAPA